MCTLSVFLSWVISSQNVSSVSTQLLGCGRGLPTYRGLGFHQSFNGNPYFVCATNQTTDAKQIEPRAEPTTVEVGTSLKVRERVDMGVSENRGP